MENNQSDYNAQFSGFKLATNLFALSILAAQNLYRHSHNVNNKHNNYITKIIVKNRQPKSTKSVFHTRTVR